MTLLEEGFLACSLLASPPPLHVPWRAVESRLHPRPVAASDFNLFI